MHRLDLIQQLIDRRRFRTYLEIGVSGGGVFFRVKCRKKIAVDPNFVFNWKGKLGEMWRNPSNIAASYFEMTSDQFFSTMSDKTFQGRTVDVVLVDGMHTFDYALRDVINSLKYLSEGGVIIMHDCNPLTEEATCSFDEWKGRGFTGYWNGDVWKVIPYLRQARPDLDVFVADCDHGLGIVRKSGHKALETAGPDVTSFRTLGFQDLKNSREKILNLRPASSLRDLVGD